MEDNSSKISIELKRQLIDISDKLLEDLFRITRGFPIDEYPELNAEAAADIQPMYDLDTRKFPETIDSIRIILFYYITSDNFIEDVRNSKNQNLQNLFEISKNGNKLGI